MRKNRFTKAEYLLSKTELEYETDKSIAFMVNKNSVRIYYEGPELKLSCTCRACSIRPNELCSHKIAAIKKLGKTEETVKTI